MNGLNTQQIVLLCLLVSFVSSVATGITTVSLLDQAPEPVTKTIDRVVERTIERVVDPVVNTVSNVAVGKPDTVVETVVVNQEDAVIGSVDKNSKSLVRIYGFTPTGAKTFLGLGLIVSSDGKVITSSSVAGASGRFMIQYPSGEFEADTVGTGYVNDTAMLQLKEFPEGKTFVPVAFADSQNIKLGQSVIAISGESQNFVSTGIVSSLESSQGVIDSQEEQPTATVTVVNTSISPDSIIRGSILLNLKGEVVGMRLGGAGANSFTSSNIIKSSITN